MTSKGRQISDLITSDISAGGAFFPDAEVIPEGTPVRLTLTVASEKLKELTGAQSLIKVEGTVVRIEPAGIAICFDGECQILGLQGI